jgi:hypothetical protein
MQIAIVSTRFRIYKILLLHFIMAIRDFSKTASQWQTVGYYERSGALVTQPELHPRNQNDREVTNRMRKYRSEGLLEVAWLTLGFSRISPIGFREVQEAYPHLPRTVLKQDASFDHKLT